MQNALNREEEILRNGLSRTTKNLREFERKYDLPSNEFYKRYQNGQLDDRNDYVDWAGEYQIFESLKEQIELLKELKL